MSASDRVGGDPWRGRAAAALAHGALLAAFLLTFRIVKARVLELAAGPRDWAALLAPELAAVLLLEAVFVGLAATRSPRLGRLWWVALVTVHLLAYTAAVLEHTFFMHTGIRLNRSLVAYGVGHLAMLQGLMAYGIDHRFGGRALAAAGCLAASVLYGLWLRRRAAAAAGGSGGRSGLPAGRRARRALLPGSLLAVGLLLSALPPPPGVRAAGLASSTFGELARAGGGTADAAARAAELPAHAAPVYEAPRTTGTVARRPNLVLLVLESTRLDVTPPWAPRERWSETPALAAVAERSWAFDQAYASVTHTTKALVGILCGMFPRSTMELHETLEGNLPLACLPHLLGELGYRTAYLQTALGAFENRPGLVANMGFESGAYQETLARPGFAPAGYLGIDEAAMLDPAAAWMASDPATPFFLTLVTITPHHPYQVAGSAPARELAEHRQRYLEAIRHQDGFVGDLFERLGRLGRLDDTLIVLVGDHGEAFGEHRRMQHDIVPYEEVVRVPLLLHAPWLLGESRRVGGLRHHVDLLPTLVELTGAGLDGRLPGRSLLTTDGHQEVVSACWFTNTCLAARRGDRKVVYHYGLRPTEVFDLAADPEERHNLAPEIATEEMRRLEAAALARRIAVDRFWDRQPLHRGPEEWWGGSQ